MSGTSTRKEPDAPSLELSLFAKAVCAFFRFLDRFIAWHKLPTFLGTFHLLAFRYELRAHNLFSGYSTNSEYKAGVKEPISDERFLHSRNSDGEWNSLEIPKMGCSGMRFGRNVSRNVAKRPTLEEIMTPNPRLVAETLMKRDKFKPATTLNLLAAAWIQVR